MKFKPSTSFQRPLALLAALALTTCLGVATGTATVVTAPNTVSDPNSGTGRSPSTQAYGGTGNLFPLFTGAGGSLHYQQVFASSQFTLLATGGENITQLSFRVSSDANGRLDRGAFATTVPLLQITLSTTGKAPDGLSATFANNVGTDATTVYGTPGVGSPLAISSTGAPVNGGTAPFDITIHFTTPFYYDPSRGNLLMDFNVYSGAASPTNLELDGVLDSTDSVSRVLTLGNATATTASVVDTLGIVTQFSTAALVPEPSAGLLIGAALLLSFLVRKGNWIWSLTGLFQGWAR